MKTKFSNIKGFTLIELMLALTIAAILLAIASSGFTNAFAAAHSSESRMALLASLTSARSKASLTDFDVVMCPSSDGTNCVDSPRWENGWVVFVDLNDDEFFNGADVVVTKQSKLDARVHIATSSGRTRLQFQPNGSNAGSNASFTFCDRRGQSKASAIVMNNAGQLRSAIPSTTGLALACAGF